MIDPYDYGREKAYETLRQKFGDHLTETETLYLVDVVDDVQRITLMTLAVSPEIKAIHIRILLHLQDTTLRAFMANARYSLNEMVELLIQYAATYGRVREAAIALQEKILEDNHAPEAILDTIIKNTDGPADPVVGQRTQRDLPADPNQTYRDLLIDALMDQDFTPDEAEGLITYRERREAQLRTEEAFRNFARWLVKQGRLNEFDVE